MSTKKWTRKAWTNEEDAILIEHIETAPDRSTGYVEAAEELDRTRSSCYTRFTRHLQTPEHRVITAKLAGNFPNWEKEESRVACIMYTGGYTVEAVADEINKQFKNNRTVAAVYTKVKQVLAGDRTKARKEAKKASQDADLSLEPTTNAGLLKEIANMKEEIIALQDEKVITQEQIRILQMQVLQDKKTTVNVTSETDNLMSIIKMLIENRR